MKCVARLKVAYEFKRQSESSDQHLRSFILEVNSRFSKVTATDGTTEEEELRMLLEGDYQQEPPQERKLVGNVQEATEPKPKSKAKPKNAAIVEAVVPPIIIKPDLQSEDEEEANDEREETIIDDDGRMYEEVLYDDTADDDGDIVVSGIDGSVYHLETDRIGNGKDDYCEEEHLTDQYSDLKVGVRKQRRVKIERGTAHVCVMCKKDFSTKTNLMRHMLTHDGKKPFMCTICGNGFTQSGSLKQHMHIHTGERPYVCPICNRGFTQSKSLTFHMRRHTGEKPFACHECGISFRQKDGLKVMYFLRC